jgi:hypothetical protein
MHAASAAGFGVAGPGAFGWFKAIPITAPPFAAIGCYFPMQNREKTVSRMSSTPT